MITEENMTLNSQEVLKFLRNPRTKNGVITDQCVADFLEKWARNYSAKECAKEFPNFEKLKLPPYKETETNFREQLILKLAGNVITDDHSPEQIAESIVEAADCIIKKTNGVNLEQGEIKEFDLCLAYNVKNWLNSWSAIFPIKATQELDNILHNGKD